MTADDHLGHGDSETDLVLCFTFVDVLKYDKLFSIFFYYWYFSVCPNFTWGFECSQDCACVQSNTEVCNPVNGECTCKEGWENTTCSDDTNECLNGMADCTLNSTCYNNDGSFKCICDPGFMMNANGTCEGMMPLTKNKVTV